MIDEDVIKFINSLDKWEKFDIYLHYVFNISYLKSYPTVIKRYQHKEYIKEFEYLNFQDTEYSFCINEKSIKEEVNYQIGRGIPDFLNDNYAIYYCGKTHTTQSFDEFIEEEPYKRKGHTYHNLVGIYAHYKLFKNEIDEKNR